MRKGWPAALIPFLTISLILSVSSAGLADANQTKAVEVNGTLTQIDGLSVVRVWGTPAEQGFALGYLIAGDDFGPMVDAVLRSGVLGDVKDYAEHVLPRLGKMDVPRKYEEQLKGLLAGIEAKIGGPVELSSLGRSLTYEDLVVINCMSDLVRTACSSFAAWDEMTEDGGTLAARNMDWPPIPALIGTQIVVAYIPPPESDTLGWVGITWPTFIGCLTGMNSEGVAIWTHDTGGHAASVDRGFTPYSMTYRETLESARAETAVQDVSGVLTNRRTIVGSNMMVARPNAGTAPTAMVFEFDGDLTDGQGVTLREPEGGESYIACTNHFRKRSPAMECGRYASLVQRLDEVAGNGDEHVTQEMAREMMRTVSATGFTHHTVVFEPDKRLMHVAVAESAGKDAPLCEAVTLDVAELLKQPEESPTEQAQWPPEIDSAERTAAVEKIAELLKEHYIFADKGEECATHIQARLADGAYDDITSAFEFAGALTQDLQGISHDLHMGVSVGPPPGPPETEPDEEVMRRREEGLRWTNYGFEKVERLEGNIGYLDLRQFASASLGGDTAVAAMNFLANSDAIIIDLRYNGGGEPSMIQLISTYFFDEPTHLNSFEIRGQETMDQFWTLTHVPGKRMTETPLYVLTSRRTFSGAEEFTYNMKNLKRATIIGETTGGGAHPVESHHATEVFDVRIPFGRAVNPVTKTNWEGTGVEPDIAVPADDALDRAHLEALKAVTEGTEDEQEAAVLEWMIEGVEAKLNPVEVPIETLRRYAGQYGPRRVWLEDDTLRYQRLGGPIVQLIPITQDMFGLSDLEEYRVQFVMDAEDDATSVIVIHISGFRDESPRTE